MTSPGTASRPFPAARVARAAGLMLVLSAVALAGSANDALAQKKSYKYETDPVRLGMNALEKGQLDEARGHFDEAIANEHRVPEAHRGIGDIHLLRGLYDDAKMEFTKAIEGSEPVAEAHAGLGLVYLRQEKNDEARQAFEAALALDKNLWRAQYGLARLCLAAGDLGGAEKLLESGKKKKGAGDGQHQYEHGMALLLMAQGKLEEAEEHALSALNLAPTDPDIVVAVGDVYDKRGVRSLAIAKYEAILADPSVVSSKAQIHYRLGVLYEREKRYDDAVTSYAAAVAADSTLAEAYLHVGAILISAKKYEEAVQPLRQYTYLVPSDPGGHKRLADAAIDTRSPTYSLVAFGAAQKAIELAPNDVANKLTLARAAAALREHQVLAIELYGAIDESQFDGRDYLNLGNLAYQEALLDPPGQRDFGEARLRYETAINLDTTLVDIHFRLGVLDLVEGDYLSAEESFTRAIEVTPNAGQAINYLGQAKLQLRKFDEAGALFGKAASLAPNDPQPLVLLAQSLTFREMYDDAIATYGRAIALDGGNAAARGGRGFIYLRQEQFETAEQDLRIATEGNPDNARNWAFLGQALHFQGKLMEARAAYDRALAIEPSNTDARQGKDALAGTAGG